MMETAVNFKTLTKIHHDDTDFKTLSHPLVSAVHFRIHPLSFTLRCYLYNYHAHSLNMVSAVHHTPVPGSVST